MKNEELLQNMKKRLLKVNSEGKDTYCIILFNI